MWVSRDRARFLVQVRARLRPLLHDAAVFRSWRGHAAREKTQGYIQTPAWSCKGFDPLTPKGALYHWAKLNGNCSPEIAEQAECLRTDAIRLLTFLSLTTKLPLAPKRELLAIPHGWRHKLQAKKKTPAWVLFYLPVSNTWKGFRFALWKLEIICGHCAESLRNISLLII